MTLSVNPTPDKTLVRLATVIAKTGLSTATIYRLMSERKFPRNVILGANSRAWVAAEVDRWIEERISARDAGTDGEARAANPAIGRRKRAA